MQKTVDQLLAELVYWSSLGCLTMQEKIKKELLQRLS